MSTEKDLTVKPVIVAESNLLTGRLIAATLQQGGHQAILAKDGDDVLKLLETHSPDVLLLNLNMTRPSGVELLRVLNQRNARLKILASTAPGQADLKTAASSLGVSGFFEAPFDPQELTEQVNTLLGTDP